MQDKDEEPLGIPTVEPRPVRPDDDSASSVDSGGKILFKKPTKRKSSESGGGGGGGGVLDASTSKRSRQGEWSRREEEAEELWRGKPE